MSLNAKKSIIQ